MSVQRIWLSLLLAVAFAPNLPAQQKQPAQEPQKPEPITKGLPQRELSEKERKKREKALLKELATYYKKWLKEDVGYIITREEKRAFLDLGTDEEQDQFIEQFWLRRDPTPDTIENGYKEEHYRRIAYANERFSIGKPGWMSDRGRIYIVWGPADEVDSRSAGSQYHQLPQEGVGTSVVYAFEHWRYRYLEGIGSDVIIEFVDRNGDGDYRLAMDREEKEVFLMPGANRALLEQMGLTTRGDRNVRAGGEGSVYEDLRLEPLERLELYGKLHEPPPVKFKDLEALVGTRISFNLLPFDVRTDFLRITDSSILVPITLALQKQNMAFEKKEGIHQALVNVFGRITTLSGRIVQTFEDVIQVDVPPSLFEESVKHPAVYQKVVPLRPGLYKLNLVLKDLNSGNVGTLEKRLTVPRFEEGQLAHSSLILADMIEHVASKNIGSGQFVIGNTKVRPVVDEQFRSDQRMGIYMQVYNLGINEQTHKPDASIEYAILRGAETVFTHTETTAPLERPGRQITLERMLTLESLQPGDYELRITVTDHVRQQTINPSASFRILP